MAVSSRVCALPASQMYVPWSSCPPLLLTQFRPSRMSLVTELDPVPLPVDPTRLTTMTVVAHPAVTALAATDTVIGVHLDVAIMMTTIVAMVALLHARDPRWMIIHHLAVVALMIPIAETIRLLTRMSMAMADPLMIGLPQETILPEMLGMPIMIAVAVTGKLFSDTTYIPPQLTLIDCS